MRGRHLTLQSLYTRAVDDQTNLFIILGCVLGAVALLALVFTVVLITRLRRADKLLDKELAVANRKRSASTAATDLGFGPTPEKRVGALVDSLSPAHDRGSNGNAFPPTLSDGVHPVPRADGGGYDYPGSVPYEYPRPPLPPPVLPSSIHPISPMPTSAERRPVSIIARARDSFVSRKSRDSTATILPLGTAATFPSPPPSLPERRPSSLWTVTRDRSRTPSRPGSAASNYSQASLPRRTPSTLRRLLAERVAPPSNPLPPVPALPTAPALPTQLALEPELESDYEFELGSAYARETTRKTAYEVRLSAYTRTPDTGTAVHDPMPERLTLQLSTPSTMHIPYELSSTAGPSPPPPPPPPPMPDVRFLPPTPPQPSPPDPVISPRTAVSPPAPVSARLGAPPGHTRTGSAGVSALRVLPKRPMPGPQISIVIPGSTPQPPLQHVFGPPPQPAPPPAPAPALAPPPARPSRSPRRTRPPPALVLAPPRPLSGIDLRQSVTPTVLQAFAAKLRSDTVELDVPFGDDEGTLVNPGRSQ